MKKTLFNVVFLVMCTTICCVAGIWTKSKPMDGGKKTEDMASVEVSHENGGQVQRDGCRYIYNMGDEYFSGELYKSPENYTLYEFEQEYDTEGNPIYTDVVIPDTIDGVPVVAIGYEVFKKHSELRTVTLGKHIVEIGKDAFYGCENLLEVTFSSDLVQIAESAFKNCVGLSEIHIPESVENIEEDAFKGCTALEKIAFNGTKLTMQKAVFENTAWLNGCREKKVPAVLKKILVDASGLAGQVKLRKEEIDYIVPGAFKDANQITSLKIEGVKSLPSYLLQDNTSIEKVVVTGVEKMSALCFADAFGVKEITIDGKVTEIPRGCFAECENLKRLEILSQNKITWGTKTDTDYRYVIFTSVFSGKQENLNIYLHSEEAQASLVLATIPKSAILHVPAEAVEEYQKYVKCKVVAL